MPEQVRCPSCDAALRVPDNLLGKNVKCPKCQTTFVAEAEEQPPAQAIVRQPKSGVRRPPPPEEMEEEDELPPQEQEEDEDRPRRRRRRGRRRSAEAESAVAGPAIALMVVCGLAIALALFNLVYSIFMGGLGASMLAKQNATMQQQMQPQLPGPGGVGRPPGQPITPPQSPISPKALMLIQLLTGVVGNIIGLVYWSFALFGAIKMRSLSSYGFAMTSCIMSMMPCSCCCILGLPFGIWGLVVLNKPEVKDAFS